MQSIIIKRSTRTVDRCLTSYSSGSTLGPLPFFCHFGCHCCRHRVRCKAFMSTRYLVLVPFRNQSKPRNFLRKATQDLIHPPPPAFRLTLISRWLSVQKIPPLFLPRGVWTFRWFAPYLSKGCSTRDLFYCSCLDLTRSDPRDIGNLLS